VYRILNKAEHLQAFFQTGELKLSSFNEFRKYPDEEAGDPGEGTGLIVAHDDTFNVKALGYETGLDAYVLCATAHLSVSVIKAFNGVGAIKINDPTHFGLCVAQSVPACVYGSEGHCDYTDDRLSHLDLTTPEGHAFFAADPTRDTALLEQIARNTQSAQQFRKPMRYAHQKEYRFFWHTLRPVDAPLMVHCPWAIERCELVMY